MLKYRMNYYMRKAVGIMTDEKNGLGEDDNSSEASVIDTEICHEETGQTFEDRLNETINGEAENEIKEPGEEAKNTPSLDLLLYDSDDTEHARYESVANYDSILGDYKETIAKALSASKEPNAADEDEEAPLLVKHKEICFEESFEDNEENDSEQELISELENLVSESTEDEESEDITDAPSEKDEEGGEQLEIDLGIPESDRRSDEDDEETESASEEQKEKSDEPKSRWIDTLFDVVELFIFTLVTVMLLTNYVFKHSEVEGESMLKTLEAGDHLIISDLFYTPDYGDLVVFTTESTGKPLIKRIVALEGDRVDFYFADGQYKLYVNGQLMEEDYAYVGGPSHVLHEVENHIVAKGKVFVLGDHRNNSTDSRFPEIGDVDTDRIVGRVLFRFYPFDSFGKVE